MGSLSTVFRPGISYDKGPLQRPDWQTHFTAQFFLGHFYLQQESKLRITWLCRWCSATATSHLWNWKASSFSWFAWRSFCVSEKAIMILSSECSALNLCHTEGNFSSCSSSLESYKESNVEGFLPFDQVSLPPKASTQTYKIIATVLNSHDFIWAFV